MSRLGTFQWLTGIGLTSKPWTDIDSFSFNDTIRTKKLTQLIGRNDRKVSVLILGPTQSGKSSFVNSFTTLAEGRIANVAHCASSSSSVTKTLHFYHTGLKKVKIYDVAGVMNGKDDIRSEDVVKILKGHIMQDYLFTQTPITEDSTYYVQNPQYEDQIKCVAFVCEAAFFLKPDVAIFAKVFTLLQQVESTGVPIRLILTKIDQLCKWIDYDITYACRSQKLKAVLESASQQLGIPECCIFPVRNYTSLERFKATKSKLIWFAWENVINCAYDYMEQIASRPCQSRPS